MPSIIYEFSKKIFRLQRQAFLRLMAFRKNDGSFLRDIKKVVIIAPHPDDECLGSGGFICQKFNDTKIDILFLTNGESAHQNCCAATNSQVGEQRQYLAVEADKTLGIPESNLHFLEGTDGSLPHKDNSGFALFAQKMAICMEKIAPEAVFCPHPFEGWPDHVAAEELTRAAINVLSIRPRLYHYCIWFWHNMPLKKAWNIDWRKAHTIDISKGLPFKQQAIDVYLEALAPCGIPWSGKLPPELLRAFEWDKELFFDADKTS
jgi:LmbE family N-acetylglucosaminyl deacetylase